MKRIAVITCLLCAFGAAKATVAQEPEKSQPPAADAAQQYANEGYTLVWADEFNEDGRPDSKNWTYERGFVRNEELQWYQEDNARCTGGLLVIEGRREQVKNPRYRPDGRDWRSSREMAEYTSSCLITRGLHAWQYGRFELRGRIDTRAGLWPAWWTLGVAGGWPAGGEIDIMEYYKGTLLANVAWSQRASGGQRSSVRWDDLKLPLTELGNANQWSQEFHVWRMDWDKDKIELSVDGRVLNTTNLQEAVNPEGTQPARPFEQPHYMLLNLAIGGTAGGDPSATEFPARFEIDYVRVYQKPAATTPDPLNIEH
jgi:beta-glucanase (GH16 family)